MIGYGIVGCGWVAPAHAAAVSLTPGAQLVGVADVDTHAATALADRFGGVALGSLEALLALPEVDAVSVCLPQHLHRGAVEAALRAGKHVLCEKPMAMTVAECDAMIAAAEAARRALGVVFNYRYGPPARLVRERLAQGAIGRARAVTARITMAVTDTYPPRRAWREARSTTSGGVLTNRAIHLIDFLVLLLGVPEAATSQLVSRDGTPLEDSGAVCLRFPGGVLGTLLATTEVAEVGTRIELFGERGTLLIDGNAVFENGTRLALPADPAVPAELADALLFGTGHVWAVGEFIQAIANGRPAPVDGEDGRRVQQVMEQIYGTARNLACAA